MLPPMLPSDTRSYGTVTPMSSSPAASSTVRRLPYMAARLAVYEEMMSRLQKWKMIESSCPGIVAGWF